MEGDTGNSDVGVHARLRTTFEPAHGSGIRLTPGGNNGQAPDIQLRQRKRNHDATGNPNSNRERVEGNKIPSVTDSDENGDHSIRYPPSKRTRSTRAVSFDPTTDPSAQHTVPQEPAPDSWQIPSSRQQREPSASQATPSLSTKESHEQSREIHRILSYPADAYFDVLSLAKGTDRLSLVETSWLDLSYLVHPRRCSLPGAVEALSRVNDAYSWIQNNTGLLEPHVPTSQIPHLAEDAPSAQKAELTPATPGKRTINEHHQPRTSSGSQTQPAQQQSESHRGTALPTLRGHAIEVPRQARNNSSASTQPQPRPQRSEPRPTRTFNPPSPRGHNINEEPESWDKSGIQTQPAPQQPESRSSRKAAQLNSPGHAIKMEPQSPEITSIQTQPVPRLSVSWDQAQTRLRPPWTYPPRQSSHVYVTNGRPTIRPAVGWQFRKLAGETRVWWQGRWRLLIQSRPEFEGVYVDKDGWIMPIMSRDISDDKWRRIRHQAMFEFNTHP